MECENKINSFCLYKISPFKGEGRREKGSCPLSQQPLLYFMKSRDFMVSSLLKKRKSILRLLTLKLYKMQFIIKTKLASTKFEKTDNQLLETQMFYIMLALLYLPANHKKENFVLHCKLKYTFFKCIYYFFIIFSLFFTNNSKSITL